MSRILTAGSMDWSLQSAQSNGNRGRDGAKYTEKRTETVF